MRILAMPHGHPLLVGVGGSGKMSLAALAASLLGLEKHRVKVTSTYSVADFRTFLLRIAKRAAYQGQASCIIVSENDLVHDGMTNIISEFLSSGFMEDVFTAEDVDEMQRRMQQELRGMGDPQLHRPRSTAVSASSPNSFATCTLSSPSAPSALE